MFRTLALALVLAGPALTQDVEALMAESLGANPLASYWLPDNPDPAAATEAIGVEYIEIEGAAGNFNIFPGYFQKGGDGFAFIGEVTELYGSEPRDPASWAIHIELTTTMPKPDDPRCCPPDRRASPRNGSSSPRRHQWTPKTIPLRRTTPPSASTTIVFCRGTRQLVLIRPAEPADHDAIWSILAPICAAGETFCVATDGGRDAAFDYWFAGRGREVFVAEAEGAVVGTSYLRPNQGGGGAHVANAGYATAAASQGKGVARALLAHSLDAARARGFRAMQFNFVVATNTRAIATWEAAGFAIVGRLPRAFAHPRHGWVDALVMFREI